jgi:hypothetical protein
MKDFRIRRVKVDPSRIRVILRELYDLFLRDGGDSGLNFDGYLERLLDMKVLVEDESDVWNQNQRRKRQFESSNGEFIGMIWEQNFVVVILVKKAEILL